MNNISINWPWAGLIQFSTGKIIQSIFFFVFMNTDFATDILRQLECMKPSHEETSEKHPLIIPICFLWEKIKLVTSVLQFLVSLKKGTLYHKSGCLLYLSPRKEKKKNTRGSLTFYAKIYIIELYIIRILKQAFSSKEFEECVVLC